MGLAFTAVLYKTEDLCGRLWQGRPEWARPAVGGLALGLLLLALPQLYGVGYPVMYKATAGRYALWFVILLTFAKIAATSLSIGIGGSGGVFAPSLFIGVTSGMAYGGVVTVSAFRSTSPRVSRQASPCRMPVTASSPMSVRQVGARNAGRSVRAAAIRAVTSCGE
jgi:H+/Cl- antiporter ClcA